MLQWVLAFVLLVSSPAFAVTGADVIHVAETQLGRSDRDPGCPADGCYLGFGDAWCSEFVSWVYNQAGIPFTGGQARPWLLPDTYAIIDWFRTHGQFLERQSGEWETFVPLMGDYVFVGRAGGDGHLTDRRHSGLVEFVDSVGTLHTLEGNNHGRPVARYSYPAYLHNALDNGPANGIVVGFGRRPDLGQ